MFDFLKKPVEYRIQRFRPSRYLYPNFYLRIRIKYRYIPFSIWADTSKSSKNFFAQFFTTSGTKWEARIYSEERVKLYAKSWFNEPVVKKNYPKWDKF